jgi:hypothetical protein
MAARLPGSSEVEIAKRLLGRVVDNKTLFQFFDLPERWKARHSQIGKYGI